VKAMHNRSREGRERLGKGLVCATLLFCWLPGPVCWGRAFPSVYIGHQEWMRANLDVERFRNGDPIGQVQTQQQWKKACDEARPVWCYCDYDPNLGAIYGKLYNGYAITDPRGLAPEGWHVPGEAEWRALVAHLGGAAVAGGKMKAGAAARWKGADSEATSEDGFAALPAGYADPHGGFHDLGEVTGFWCVSDSACYWSVYDGGSEICRYYGSTPYYGFSVRCVRSAPAAPGPAAGAYLGQTAPGRRPQVFAPGIVCRPGQFEGAPAWSPDGKTSAYLGERKEAGGIRQRLLQQGPGGTWADVDISAVLRSERAYGLRFAPDDTYLSFVLPDAGDDIWIARRDERGWSVPVALPGSINTEGREANPMFTRTGALYFIANSRLMGGKGFRTCGGIFRAECVDGTYASAEMLPFCTWFDEEHFFVAPDESYVIFSSQRRNAYGWNELLYGDYDLFITFRQGPGSWTHPRILGPEINTKGQEIDPFVTADGRYFFFCRSDRAETDICWMDAGFIDTLRSEVNQRESLLAAPDP